MTIGIEGYVDVLSCAGDAVDVCNIGLGASVVEGTVEATGVEVVSEEAAMGTTVLLVVGFIRGGNKVEEGAIAATVENEDAMELLSGLLEVDVLCVELSIFVVEELTLGVLPKVDVVETTSLSVVAIFTSVVTEERPATEETLDVEMVELGRSSVEVNVDTSELSVVDVIAVVTSRDSVEDTVDIGVNEGRGVDTDAEVDVDFTLDDESVEVVESNVVNVRLWLELCKANLVVVVVSPIDADADKLSEETVVEVDKVLFADAVDITAGGVKLGKAALLVPFPDWLPVLTTEVGSEAEVSSEVEEL